jgi:hypothetical protein
MCHPRDRRGDRGTSHRAIDHAEMEDVESFDWGILGSAHDDSLV